jgi:hypothetical protein
MTSQQAAAPATGQMADAWYAWKILSQRFGQGSPQAVAGRAEYDRLCDQAGTPRYARGN